MNKNELNKWLGDTLTNPLYGLPARFPNRVIDVTQNRQPQGQARPDTQATVFFSYLFSQQVGQRGVYDRLPNNDATMGRLVRQANISVFQFSCMAYRYPQADDSTDPQASDILDVCAAIFKLPEVIRDLKTNHKAGIISVSQIRGEPRVNDREQFEYEPSFDLTVSHTNEFVYGVPRAKALGFNIKRV